jgi:peptide/nickel transport system substrate-binding protein
MVCEPVVRTVLVLILVLAACSGEAPTGALVWARSADSTTLDPAEAEWAEDAKIVNNIFETLVAFDEDLSEARGRLATSWSLSEDAKTLTFGLRTGVRFHDGAPFNAEAVAFTFGRLIDPRHPCRPRAVPYAANFSVIERVDAAGPERVVFKLKEPCAVILANLSLYAASIVSPDSVRRHGHRFGQNACGTGPYRLGPWDRDVRLVLERFDDYWGGKAPVPRVIVTPVPSPQTAVQKLLKGEVHAADHVRLGDLDTLERDARTHVVWQPPMNVCYLGFNMGKFPYSDVNFRRAVSLALDRETLNAFVYKGLAVPASHVVPPAIWKDASRTPAWESDLEKAKEHLGLVRVAVKEVELIHMTFARPYAPEPARVAEYVKDRLQRIGLDVRLSGYDKSAYIIKTRERDHPMFLMGWIADHPEADNVLYGLLHGDNAGGLNGSFFDDATFNDAVDRGRRELDPVKRKELYALAYARFREELPVVPLVHSKAVVGLSRQVEYRAHPLECRFYQVRFKEGMR